MKNAMKYPIWPIVILLLLVFGIGTAFAAKPAPIPTGTGTLTGKVTIAGTRTAIVGATITVVGSAGTYSAVTNSKGSYTLTPLAGGYTLTAAAAGYAGQSASVTIKAGTTTVQNFALSKVVVTTGVLSGSVSNAATGAALAGAAVAADHGGYSAVTGSDGKYSMTVAAGSYALTASAADFVAATQTAAVVAGGTTTTNFALAPVAETLAINSLTATPDSFVEAATAGITLSAVVEGTPSLFDWTQLDGPLVPLTALSATSASADVSTLAVAAEAELVFQLTIGDGTAAVSKTVTVAVQPADMVQYPAANVQIGGSTTATARFQYAGAEWCLFNIGTALKATPVGMNKGAVSEVILPNSSDDIEILNYNGQVYALLACGGAGVVVVNISNPALMTLENVLPVNFYMDGVIFAEGGGSILYDNIFSSSASPITSLASDGTSLYLGNNDFGIHKTALANVFGDVREVDGTLKIDQEVRTVQYAGEHGWGGPFSLKLYGGKLFAGLGVLGMGIFDPATLEQVGRYNLYTDEARVEDYTGAMAISQAVAADASGDLFIDDFTGMPDYRQVNYEITVVMKGTGTSDPTPWADLEREAKWYYETIDVDVAQQGERTIAYLALGLGGVAAVDVTGFAQASPAAFMNAQYLGYFPAVPANGPYDTGSTPSSLLPYEGAGMLKEAGVTAVRVQGGQLYLTDHFAGLVILNGATEPELWHGDAPPYNNDTDGIPNNNVPEFEDITSYDMSPWDPLDNESLPRAYYQAPSQLATRELKGHGYSLELMDGIDLTAPGQVDVLECSSAGGFVFVDVTNIAAPVMTDRFVIQVYFPSTDEIGAAVDGSATQAIAIGHADSIMATKNHIYLSDGPHGITAWRITDAQGYPTDSVHVVANTLQDEYPEEYAGELIYPASHTVRNVIDPSGQFTWALCVSNGMRRVPIAAVEAGQGQVGAPELMKLHLTDSYEHNADWGVVKALNYQDQAYDVEFVGNFAYVADGTNGLTIYDVTKDPTRAGSGFFVGNIGASIGMPLLGTASGIELWNDAASGRRYAVLACGPYGVGVVDVTDVGNMRIVKVFEPIKYENGDLGSADGQAIDVEVIGDKAYFTYDSFGVLCYALSDLIAAVPDGVDPTELFKKSLDGTVIYDHRPVFLGRFKLQEVPGYEEVSGGAVKMAYTEVGGKLMQYVAFGEAGLVKIDYTDSSAPLFVEIKNTAAECVGATIANGRLYVADHGGGLVLFK